MSKGYMAGDYAISPAKVTFKCDDQAYQRVFDRCEALEKENVQAFGARRVVQEGAKYHGVWLETQPMGGEMYIKRDMDAGFNNILIFMENQRRDGRLPGMIRYAAPWNGLSAHFDWMQGDFFTVPALRMAWHIGRDRGYLERLYATLRDFDAFLPNILGAMGDQDLLLITADHGCDPTWTGTDHTRERVPLLCWHRGMRRAIDLGVRNTYADMAATICEGFGLPDRFDATSFYQELEMK